MADEAGVRPRSDTGHGDLSVVDGQYADPDEQRVDLAQRRCQQADTSFYQDFGTHRPRDIRHGGKANQS